MQLLTAWTANVLLTTIIVCASVSALAMVPTWFGWHRERNKRLILFAVFSFSMLGFVTGTIMGDSRAAVVGTVVPAVLTLLGGIAVYVIGSKGVKQQAIVSALLLCFAFTLLIGTLFGTRLRVEYEFSLENPERLKLRELASEQIRYVVELQRLENYVDFLQIKKAFAEKYHVDLTGFAAAGERKEPTKPSSTPTETLSASKPAQP